MDLYNMQLRIQVEAAFNDLLKDRSDVLVALIEICPITDNLHKINPDQMAELLSQRRFDDATIKIVNDYNEINRIERIVKNGYFTQIVSGHTLMCWCARKGLEYSVARLIQAGHSPLAKCEDGKSCIEHCAASCVKNCFWGDCFECRHAGIKILLMSGREDTLKDEDLHTKE